MTNLIFRKELLQKQHRFFGGTENSKYRKNTGKRKLDIGIAILPSITKIKLFEYRYRNTEFGSASSAYYIYTRNILGSASRGFRLEYEDDFIYMT